MANNNNSGQFFGEEASLTRSLGFIWVWWMSLMAQTIVWEDPWMMRWLSCLESSNKCLKRKESFSTPPEGKTPDLRWNTRRRTTKSSALNVEKQDIWKLTIPNWRKIKVEESSSEKSSSLGDEQVNICLMTNIK